MPYPIPKISIVIAVPREATKARLDLVGTDGAGPPVVGKTVLGSAVGSTVVVVTFLA